jgi:hypothetical protein
MITRCALAFGVGWLVVLVAACGSDGSAGDGCGDDEDCKGDRVCRAGACVDPASGVDSSPGSDDGETPNRNGSGGAASGDVGPGGGSSNGSGAATGSGAASSGAGDTSSSSGAGGGWCPFPPAAIDCALSCTNEIVLCEKQCDGTPGCSYQDWQYDTCVQHCEWDLVYPDELLLELQGCWQLTTDCAEHSQCLYDADCSAYDMPYDGGGDDERGG